MPRSIWSGAITFGLVNVPIDLVSAVRDKSVHFHQLHDSDGVRIRQKRVCPADGEEVPYENIVKGYEVAKDQYVQVTDQDLEALEPKKTKTLEIEEFVALAEIDPIYYDQPYYVVPANPGATKAYELLKRALAGSAKVGIGRIVLRTKEYLAAIRPTGNVLTLETMNFPDEIVDPKTLEVGTLGTRLAPREIAMAEQLIEQLSAPFDPAKYKDEFRERILTLVRDKAAGVELPRQPAREHSGKVVDLLSALKASLAGGRRGEVSRKPPASHARERRERSPTPRARASQAHEPRRPRRKST